MQYFIAIKSKEGCSGALEAARRYSPNIEVVDETTLVFDLTGNRAKDAPGIAGELREKFESVAVSENLAAALLLARWAQGFKVQGSKFKVCETDDDKNRTRSSSQIQNSKPKTQNLLHDAFKAGKSEYRAGTLITSGEEFNARADRSRRRKPIGRAGVREGERVGVRESGRVGERESGRAGVRESGSAGEQTQNSTLNVEPGTLNQLPVEAISEKREFLELMDSWAIHDLDSFSQLPEDEMVERFGLEIIELRRQAAGEAYRAPNWNVKEDKFFWAKELEGGIETIEPLNFVLSKGVEQIFRNLDYVGLSTQAAKITLHGRKNKKIYPIRLVFPTKNQKIWIRQIVTKIELDLPGFNIDYVEIEFRSTKPRTIQSNLYSGTILEPENLNLIVSKLKKVVGLEKIGLPKLRDSWSASFYMTEDLSPLIMDTGTRGQGVRESGCAGEREGEEVQSSESPESSVISHQLSVVSSVFYYLPQPVRARVFFESGEPKALIIKGKRQLVRTSGGPWRKDAEWYRAKKWQRDEWDIETETGAVYRVFTDKNGEAFVDGGYD